MAINATNHESTCATNYEPTCIAIEKMMQEKNNVLGRLSYDGKEKSVAFDYLYNRLNILDSKVSALLSVNGIFLAVAGIITGKLSLSAGHIILLKVSIIFWVISTALCLMISRLKWEYLDTTASNSQFYIDKIIAVTVMRTRSYNAALGFVILSIILYGLVAYQSLW